jgi:hypothetical protein
VRKYIEKAAGLPFADGTEDLSFIIPQVASYNHPFEKSRTVRNLTYWWLFTSVSSI